MSQKSAVKILILTSFLLFFLPLSVSAVSLGKVTHFFIDSEYDLSNRDETSAVLERIDRYLYFYLDIEWWNSLGDVEKLEARQAMRVLNEEFENTIYPRLTSTFGPEWKPGIDKDTRITILIHPMREDAGAYFNSGDEYNKVQVPVSNEREMIYLNANRIGDSLAKGFLAHEFIHLITFNQKEKIRGVSEEIWFNEMRAEYVSTFLGYDQDFTGSNLEKRIQDFLTKPSTSLTSWENTRADYGVVALFAQYVADHYGKEIFINSLHSSKVGIASFNEALESNGFEERFPQIFTDWTIAVLVNDCTLGEKYCYKSENLKDFRVVPQTNFLPFVGESSLNYGNSTQNWTGNWLKIIGGAGALKFEFTGSKEAQFQIPYILEDQRRNLYVKRLILDSRQKGVVYVPDFGTKNVSLTIIPSIQNGTFESRLLEPFYSFFWSATTQQDAELAQEQLKNQLLSTIAALKEEIARIQAQIYAILVNQGTESCSSFTKDLFFGIRNNSQVNCLQEFLKAQGGGIYPEGLVTGNFGPLTLNAVVRFQERYAEEVLAPIGLVQGTGYVGSLTRAKINSLLL